MVSQTTKGVKVTVKTAYDGHFYKDRNAHYAFTYTITIENMSEDFVQVKGRFWEIYDSLDRAKVVHGEGVVGEQPIIGPGSLYTYTSGCVLNSTLGGMRGFYEVMNLSTNRFFNVEIPGFKLAVPFVLN